MVSMIRMLIQFRDRMQLDYNSLFVLLEDQVLYQMYILHNLLLLRYIQSIIQLLKQLVDHIPLLLLLHMFLYILLVLVLLLHHQEHSYMYIELKLILLVLLCNNSFYFYNKRYSLAHYISS